MVTARNRLCFLALGSPLNGAVQHPDPGRSIGLSEQVVESLAKKMGKNPLRCNDMPGFVSNRVLMPLINEAAFTLMENVADAPTIDEIMKQGCNFPMGPLTLADFIGVDVCLNILEVLHRDLGDPKFRPCPLLRKMVDAGHCGRKTGRGIHSYS